MEKRRDPGAGSVHERSRDGLWVFAVSLGTTETGARRRKAIRARTREVLRERVLDQLGVDIDAPTAPNRSVPRTSALETARSLGTRTSAEWGEIVRATTACRYCEVELHYFNEAKDHVVPIARGGSDLATNLQRICWECNAAKGSALSYVYDGERPRPFTPSPMRRREYASVIAAREAFEARPW